MGFKKKTDIGETKTDNLHNVQFDLDVTKLQTSRRLDVEKKKMLDLCRKMRKLGLKHMPLGCFRG